MAGALENEKLARHVYGALLAASCPLVDGLDLREADSMLELLCAPSQLRTNILAWICSSINPNFGNSKVMSVKPTEQDALLKEVAMLGQELMLYRADDLDRIREGNGNLQWQLQFLEQLLTLVPGCKKSAEPRMDSERLLNELYAAENLPHFSQMLQPTLDPWPAHIQALRKSSKSSSKPSRGEAADLAPLLHQTQSALKQLQSECEFLSDAVQSPGVFSPSSLRVAACDLQQLMTTFSHVYETDLRAYCGRDPISFSTETGIFQRVFQLLHALIMELDMLKEVSEVSVSTKEEVNRLQTQPCLQSRGDKHTLQDQLDELSRRIQAFLSLLHS